MELPEFNRLLGQAEQLLEAWIAKTMRNLTKVNHYQ